MKKISCVLIYCLITMLASAQQRPAPTTLSDIQGPSILFVDMADAAHCLNLNVNDCDTIQALASTYDVAKWIGTIVCNQIPAGPGCADCYTQIDGMNIVGVIPVIKEELREPWFCDSTLHQNHAITGGSEYTPAFYASGSFSRNPWKQTVAWADIRAFAGATSNSISVATLNSYPSLGNLNLFPMERTTALQYFDTPVVFGGPASIFTNVTRTDPVLTVSQQTSGTQNYAQVGQATSPAHLPSSTFSVGQDNYKLCGIKYEVRELGSINPDTLEGLAHNLAWLKSTNTSLNGLASTWVTSQGGNGAAETDADFNTVTGLWRCNTFKPYGLTVPENTPIP